MKHREPKHHREATPGHDGTYQPNPADSQPETVRDKLDRLAPLTFAHASEAKPAEPGADGVHRTRDDERRRREQLTPTEQLEEDREQMRRQVERLDRLAGEDAA